MIFAPVVSLTLVAFTVLMDTTASGRLNDKFYYLNLKNGYMVRKTSSKTADGANLDETGRHRLDVSVSH